MIKLTVLADMGGAHLARMAEIDDDDSEDFDTMEKDLYRGFVSKNFDDYRNTFVND